MAIDQINPFTIIISGEVAIQQADDKTGTRGFLATEALTPGHLAETFPDSGDIGVRKSSSATEQAELLVVLDSPELNRGIDVVYAIGEHPKLGRPALNAVLNMLVADSETVNGGTRLGSNGDGTLATGLTTAAANVAIFKSLSNLGTTSGVTRCQVQRIQ